MPSRKPAANNGSIEAALESAAQGGLVYVSDAEPGLRRRRAGKGFRYLDAAPARTEDAQGAVAVLRGGVRAPAERGRAGADLHGRIRHDTDDG